MPWGDVFRQALHDISRVAFEKQPKEKFYQRYREFRDEKSESNFRGSVYSEQQAGDFRKKVISGCFFERHSLKRLIRRLGARPKERRPNHKNKANPVLNLKAGFYPARGGLPEKTGPTAGNPETCRTATNTTLRRLYCENKTFHNFGRAFTRSGRFWRRGNHG